VKSQMTHGEKLMLALTLGLAYSALWSIGNVSNELVDEVNLGSQERARGID